MKPVGFMPGGESKLEKESCSRVPMGNDEPMLAGGGNDPGPGGNDCGRDDWGWGLGIFILFEKGRPNPELGGGWLGGPLTSEKSLKLSRPGRNAISVWGGKPLLGAKPDPEKERRRP
jgi:hypothetical protein